MSSVGTPLFARADIPSLSNQCWSDSEFATAKCCKQFNADRVAVKGSTIAGCTYHADSKAWTDCISNNTGSSSTECQSSGSGPGSRSKSGSSPNSNPRGIHSGGVVVLGLVLGQILSAFVLS
ncbi:hypothetical protein DFH09DRAFT_1071461 [Mycena vulgaris]|nr:hypothetical protein DFH09DRAFT_1071461 [Mycena vulgaris]